MSEIFTSGYSPAYLAEDKGYLIMAIAITFIVVDVIFTLLRFTARRISDASFGWNDYLLVPSLLSNLTTYALCISMVFFGDLGRHQATILIKEPEKLVVWAKCLYALEWLYLFSTALPRLSVLCVYTRIFAHSYPLERRASHTLVAVILLHVVGSLISSTFQCYPFPYQWDKSIPRGSCSRELVLYRWMLSFPNILIDLAMLVLPIRMLWKLQVVKMLKLKLIIIFLIGNLCFVASCIRFSYLFSENPFGEDGTWISVNLVLWTMIESWGYLKAACLLLMRPLILPTIKLFRDSIGRGKPPGSQRLYSIVKNSKSQMMQATESDSKRLVPGNSLNNKASGNLNTGNEVMEGKRRDQTSMDRALEEAENSTHDLEPMEQVDGSHGLSPV